MKKTKKKRAKRVLAMQLLGGGELRRARLPERQKRLMYSVYRWKKGEIVQIEALPGDPYSAGHSLFKTAEAMASIYMATGMTYAEAMATMLDSIVDHAQTQMAELIAAMPPEDTDAAFFEGSVKGKVH